MPKVTVNATAAISPQQAFEKVCQMLESDKELHKLDPSYACEFDSSSLKGTAKGKMFNAKMEVTEQSGGSAVEIIVDLPMALTLAKGVVSKTLQKKLDSCLL